jgi:hypothetical protein
LDRATGKTNVVYFDESGFASHAHRPHGWAIHGREVFGRIDGKNHNRTNLIVAQRRSDWLAPMLFKASCTHLTVTTWIEKMLLSPLRLNSLVAVAAAGLWDARTQHRFGHCVNQREVAMSVGAPRAPVSEELFPAARIECIMQRIAGEVKAENDQDDR